MLSFGSHVVSVTWHLDVLSDKGMGGKVTSLPVLTEKKTVLDGDNILNCHRHGCITSIVTKREPMNVEHKIDQKFIVKARETHT